MQGWARDPRDDIEITIPRSAKTSISESDKCSEKEVDEKMHSDSDNVVKEETDLSAERKGSWYKQGNRDWVENWKLHAKIMFSDMSHWQNWEFRNVGQWINVAWH